MSKITELRQQYSSFDIVYSFASGVHAKDKRKDGQPYISHIDGVIEGIDCQFIGDTYENLIIVAALHDVLEDHSEVQLSDIQKWLSAAGIENTLRRTYILNALVAISKKIKGKKTYVSYVEYVERVKNIFLARHVKISDLKHNMSNLEVGNLLEKYQLTLYVLEQQNV